MMLYNSLENYYRLNASLIYDRLLTPTEIDSLFPWEREIYVALIIQKKEEEAKEMDKLKP